MGYVRHLVEAPPRTGPHAYGVTHSAAFSVKILRDCRSTRKRELEDESVERASREVGRALLATTGQRMARTLSCGVSGASRGDYALR